MGKSVELYFTELRCIHTHRALSDCRCDRGLHTEWKLWVVFYRDIFEYEEIWDVRWVVKNQFCRSVNTPVHLKSSKSVHILKLLIPSLPHKYFTVGRVCVCLWSWLTLKVWEDYLSKEEAKEDAEDTIHYFFLGRQFRTLVRFLGTAIDYKKNVKHNSQQFGRQFRGLANFAI